MKKHIGILCIGLLAGCDSEVIEDTKKSFDKSFRDNYKASFIESCTESSGDERFRESCVCIAEDLLSNLSVSELMDGDKTRKRVEEFSLAKCKP